MSPTVLPTRSRPAEGGTIRGAHVLWAFLAFFGIILAVNMVLLYKALSTHSGLEANEPYRKGLAYNTRIAADERQHALGWHDALTVEATGRVLVALRDSAGAPVSGLAVKGRIGRPATTRDDVALAFSEAEPGRYVAEARPIAAGNWRVEVEAHGGSGAARAAEGAAADPLYRIRRRVWLKP